MKKERFLIVFALPALILLVALAAWEACVRVNQIPPYILPAPSLVFQTLIADWPILAPSLVVTLTITLLALAIAVVTGVGLAVILASAKWIEYAFMPFAIFLQVTPIIAIAPLILIYMPNTWSALLLIAWIVAFFPILSSTTFGLNSADKNLRELFQLYGASRWQTMRLLRLPSAIPYFLSGLRIAGGLALIGAIVAEFAAGSVGTSSGLAFRLLEASYRLNIPRVFAALVLITFTGLVLYMTFSLLANLLLRRWHDSSV